MAIKSTLWSLAGAAALSSLSALIGSHGIAVAGVPNNCGPGGACNLGVNTLPGHPADFGPITVETRTPYDRRDTVKFQRAPHVSILRVHSLGPNVALSDAPGGFTGGCHPSSTTYCRQNKDPLLTIMPVPPQAPLMQRPLVQRPLVQPSAIQAPIMAPPVRERLVAVGGGFDPSKFAPRQYGSTAVTPGIAHVPTAIVDRDPRNAQRVLDTGKAVHNAWTPGGTTPALANLNFAPRVSEGFPAPGQALSPSPLSSNLMPPLPPRPMMAPIVPQPVLRQPVPGQPLVGRPLPAAPLPVLSAPASAPQGLSIPTGYPGAAGAPIAQGNGQFIAPVGADGTYWEKVSGPTLVGGLPASEVLCKRQLPSRAPAAPVFGVPQPRPMPVTCNANAPHPTGHQRY